MTSDEAKKKTCPIQSHPRSDGMCNGDSCMLWVDFGDDKGNCAKRLEVDVLDEINNNRNNF